MPLQVMCSSSFLKPNNTMQLEKTQQPGLRCSTKPPLHQHSQWRYLSTSSVPKSLVCSCCCHCSDWGNNQDSFAALGMCKSQARNSPWPEESAVLLDKIDGGRERWHREIGARVRSNCIQVPAPERLSGALSCPLNQIPTLNRFL